MEFGGPGLPPEFFNFPSAGEDKWLPFMEQPPAV